MNDINDAVSKIETSQDSGFTKLTESNKNSLSGLTDKLSEAINDINDAVSKIETSQENLNTNLNKSLSNLASNTENTNQSIISLKKAMQEMVTLSE